MKTYLPYLRLRLCLMLIVGTMFAVLTCPDARADEQTLRVDPTVFQSGKVTITPPSSGQAMPEPAVQAVLIQSTIAALNHANLTGDYGVFLKLATTGFRQANTAELLFQRFKPFRDNRIDLAPVVLYPIRWTYAPTIQNGALRLVGVFPSKPQETSFDISYAIEDGRWRVVAISVSVKAPSGK